MVFILLLCWIVYVWVTAPTFGVPGVCNGATIYVIFFFNVRVTIGGLRWFFVTAAGIALFVMLCLPIYAILLLLDLGTHREMQSENANSTATVRVSDANALEMGETPPHAGSGVEPQRIAGPSNNPTPSSPTATETSSQSTASDNFPRQTPSKQGLLGRLLTAVYGVTMLELTIQRNKKNVEAGENQWTFGQIVAMLITVGSLNEVLHYFLGEEGKRKKKKTCKYIYSSLCYLA